MLHADWVELKKKSPVRIQWDPERNIKLEKLNYRSIQIGLSEIAVQKYLSDWIQRVTDVTQLVHSINKLVQLGDNESAINMLPLEKPYPLPDSLSYRLGINTNKKGSP